MIELLRSIVDYWRIRMKRLARIAIVALPLMTLAAPPHTLKSRPATRRPVKFEGMLGRIFNLFGGKGAKEGIEGSRPSKGPQGHDQRHDRARSSISPKRKSTTST